MGWYAIEIIGRWAQLIIVDEQGHETTTDFVNGSRQPGASYDYWAATWSDISRQSAENIIPLPPLCTTWAVTLGAVVLAMLGDPTLLVARVTTTDKPGWIPEGKEMPVVISKGELADEEPPSIEPTDPMDTAKRNAIRDWMELSGVPTAICDVDKAATWGAATGQLQSYVSQLQKAR